ncbi:L,D-transpeptidase family protein [Altererythrobacter salegens]|uniref:L,D-transpeptidase family protein n=1 Tax=Croceibacterium salegens TaxID=1737568 RepID=A0A6I4SWS5_9SPHN|nr:L,D-transpeptidase [Croceibacterium salegens]MXO58812.1 L,D-transpeptidase family protein [Croceibacterium salegens]
MRKLFAPIVAACLLSIPTASSAQGFKSSSPPEFARKIDALKPGEWVWAPQVAPSGPVMVYVDLTKQIGVVYRNGVRIAATTVSTGKAGHSTPTGVFTILQKDADHRSSTYNNAPMPYQQRLTWDGVALHAGGLPGYPESHGCVHLPYEFARELFEITKLGVTVVVEGDAQRKPETSENSLLSPFDDEGNKVEHTRLESGEEFRWQPELATEGPMTIIVAKLDQRIVVLRAGVEIGRSVAAIDPIDDGSHVMTLSQEGGQNRWYYVGLPGHEEEEGRLLEDSIMKRVQMPRQFLELLRTELKPGDTILTTNSRVTEGPLERLTIMDAVAPGK